MEHIVDAWQLKKWEHYRDIKRLGRKTRIVDQSERNYGKYLIIFGV